MSEQSMSPDSNPEILIELTEGQRPAAETPREEYDGAVIITDTRLSAAQHRIAHGLHRLYQSLCGGRPGQYWPQQLLDSGGGFNRLPFPVNRPPVPYR